MGSGISINQHQHQLTLHCPTQHRVDQSYKNEHKQHRIRSELPQSPFTLFLTPPSPLSSINSTMVNDFPWVVLPPDGYPASDSDTSSRVGSEFPPPGMIGVDQHGNLSINRQVFDSLITACNTDDDDDSVASGDSLGVNRRFQLPPHIPRTFPPRAQSHSKLNTQDPTPVRTHPMSTRSLTCTNPTPPKPADKTSLPTSGGPATRTRSRPVTKASTSPKTTLADKQPRRA